MQIDSKTVDLKHLLVGRDLYFRVPPYQRNYSWGIGQVEQLWDDVLESFDQNVEYFMGPFVLLHEAEDYEEEYDIVDGQQRLTTFTMLFALIRRYSEFFVNEPTHQIFSNWIDNDVNREAMRRTSLDARSLLGWDDDGFHYFLTLNRKDRNLFKTSILGRELPPNQPADFRYASNTRVLEKSYKILATKLQSTFLVDPGGAIKLKAFLKHVAAKLKFLRIAVKSEIDAYLLFEGLNYKGMTLSVADLLKNRILMTCEESLRDDVATTWDDISTKIEIGSRSDFAEFIRTYWNSFFSSPLSPVSKKELYSAVRKHINEDPNNASKLVYELEQLADFYVDLTRKGVEFPSTQHPPGTTEGTFNELSLLKFSVCNSLIMYCKRHHEDKLLALSKKCINYLFRVITVGGLSVSIAKAAMNGALKTLREGGTFLEAMSKLSCGEMPDATFIDRLTTSRFSDNQAMRYYLLKLLIADTGEEFIPLGDKIQLEHILPQKPEPHWRDFTTPAETELDDWIYSLGNLTLLIGGKNASIGNRSFADKVQKYVQASAQSPNGTRIEMTYKLHEDYESGQTSWTAVRIAERAKILANKASAIWDVNI